MAIGAKTKREAETLARDILRKYFCESNVEFMISTLAEDVIWMGASRNQRAEGKEAVAAFFRAGESTLIACNMDRERYVTMEVQPGCYLCEADCWILPKAGQEAYFETHERVTFLFRRSVDRLETVHIHNSIDFTDIRDDELFAVKASKTAYDKLQDVLSERSLELERKSRFLNQLFDTVPCGILQLSTKEPYSFVSINKRVWRFYGFASETEFRNEMTGLFDLVLEKDHKEIHDKLEKLLTGEGNRIFYTRESRLKNGESVWISVVMERVDNADGEDVIQVIFTDITELHKLTAAREEERLIENRSLRAAICIYYQGIMLINLTRDTYNCFLEEQDCFYPSRTGSFEALGEKLIQEDSQMDYQLLFNCRHIMERFQSGERELYLEFRRKGLDGRYHWISIHIIAIDNPVGEDVLAVRLVKVLDEKRARKAKEEQLLKDALAAAVAANAAKGDFLSRISHDIRTPMNAIIGMSTIGQAKAKEPDRVVDCFCKIERSSKYLMSLLDDILDMSKIDNGKMPIVEENFDFNEWFEEMLSIFLPQAENNNLVLEAVKDSSVERFYKGDALRLGQVISNLLSNAIKFTSSGGKVTFQVKERKRLNGFAYLDFKVQDSGVGMTPEFMKVMFQPFEQECSECARNGVGTGLGLAICHSLVQLMGGEIHATSQKGEGSSFYVMLPLRLSGQQAEPMRNNMVQEDNCKLFGKRILLVEDNDLNREVAKEMLEEYGMVVDTAEDGKEALEIFSRSPKKHYFAILMDIRMPVMDGLEATRGIRGMDKEDAATVPILAMTANAFEEDRRQAMEAGINEYLVKPLNIEKLLSCLRQL